MMPNPLKKFFRRPSVKRVKKVASRHFRKFFPERGYYDVGKYRERGGGVPDWLSRQMKHEDAAWQHGLQPRPYKGRRHTLDEARSGGRVRPYHTIEGFVPCGEGMVSGFSQSISMGDLSELAANDSRDQTQYAYCSIPPDTSQQSAAFPPTFQQFEPPGVSTPETCAIMYNRGIVRRDQMSGSAPAALSDTSTTHRELMFMLDQLEMIELERIMKDLRQFQSSRRKLMFDVSSLSASSTPPAALMKSMVTPQPATIMAPSSPSITQC